MILLLFGFFVALSLILIVIGLTRPSESAQAIIGFLFLFLLSFVIIGNSLEYQTGEKTNITFIDSANYTETTTYTYSYYNDTTSLFNTHRVGYFLAIASGIGMIGVFYSIRGHIKGDR